MLQAVIFDFDGVIVNSEPLHHALFNRVLAEVSIEIPWEEYKKEFIGFDDRDALRYAFKKHRKYITRKKLQHFIDAKALLVETAMQRGEAAIFPGALELLRSISPRVPVAICSGALRSDIMPIVEQHALTAHLQHIVSAEDTPKSKPDPAPYLHTLSLLPQVEATQTVAIEDTPAGIRSAKSAGLQVLAVTNSFPSSELTEADAITDSLLHVNRKSLEDLIY